MSGSTCTEAVKIRSLKMSDLEAVVRLDTVHAGSGGKRKEEYWRELLRSFLSPGKGLLRIGLAAEFDGRFAGYLLGEVRALEFGSDPSGWIFAVGVDPDLLRNGIASQMLEVARERFRQAGVERLRTMVRLDDIRVLSFFRSNGFVGGRYVQLEQDLEAGR